MNEELKKTLTFLAGYCTARIEESKRPEEAEAYAEILRKIKEILCES